MQVRVRVLSRAAVEDGAAEGVDTVISIRSPADGNFDMLDMAVAQALSGEVDAALVLRFDDIGVPSYGPHLGAGMEHLVQALDFVRAVRSRLTGAVVAVHGEHGVSRSPAMALAIIADVLGPGREAEAVAELLRQDVDTRMIPNPLLVSLADTALWRYGALDAALATVSPRYVQWRDHWRRVAEDPERHWRSARSGRFRRRPARTPAPRGDCLHPHRSLEDDD